MRHPHAWRPEYDDALEAAKTMFMNMVAPLGKRVIIRKSGPPDAPVMVIRQPRDGGWGWDIFIEIDPLTPERRLAQRESAWKRRRTPTIEQLWAVLDEAYREDVGLLVWHEHPELEMKARYERWSEIETAREDREREAWRAV